MHYPHNFVKPACHIEGRHLVQVSKKKMYN